MSCVRVHDASRHLCGTAEAFSVAKAHSAAVVTASTHLARLHSYRVRGSLGTVTVPNAFIPGDDAPTQLVIEHASEI